MQAHKSKLRFRDIRAGVSGYVSHPIYGVERVEFLGKPYWHKDINSWFVPTKNCFSDGTGSYKTERSLQDMGIYSAYNGRRTFRKLKQAKEWQKHWGSSLSFQRDHARHEALVEAFEYDDMPSWDIDD
jgi:hypothetical protein